MWKNTRFRLKSSVTRHSAMWMSRHTQFLNASLLHSGKDWHSYYKSSSSSKFFQLCFMMIFATLWSTVDFLDWRLLIVWCLRFKESKINTCKIPQKLVMHWEFSLTVDSGRVSVCGAVVGLLLNKGRWAPGSPLRWSLHYRGPLQVTLSCLPAWLFFVSTLLLGCNTFLDAVTLATARDGIVAS